MEKALEIIHKKNSDVELAIISVLGDREEQQDSYCYELSDDECILSVCDGMGGHRGGRLASQIAAGEVKEKYRPGTVTDARSFLEELIENADKKIAALTDGSGNALDAGSTMINVFIKNGELFWAAVGDSRIYLIRNGEMVQVTLDHTYHEYLKEQLYNAQITDEEYSRENSRMGDALINFAGIGEIRMTDHNDSALKLMPGDRLLLTTDGLYKIVEDESIKNIICNFGNVAEAVKYLEIKAGRLAKKRNISRDNMTVALVKKL